MSSLFFELAFRVGTFVKNGIFSGKNIPHKENQIQRKGLDTLFFASEPFKSGAGDRT